MIVDVQLLPTLERARAQGCLTPQQWEDNVDGEIQALILHFGLHARKADPRLARALEDAGSSLCHIYHHYTYKKGTWQKTFLNRTTIEAYSSNPLAEGE